MRDGIKVRVLNMGTIEDTEIGRLILHIMLAFAEFERDMIVSRTQGGRAYKRATDPDTGRAASPSIPGSSGTTPWTCYGTTASATWSA